MLAVDVAACAGTQRAASHTVGVSLTSLLSEHARDPQGWSGRAPDEGGWPSDDLRRRESGRVPFELEGSPSGEERLQSSRAQPSRSTARRCGLIWGGHPLGPFSSCELPVFTGSCLQTVPSFTGWYCRPSSWTAPSPYPSWTLHPVFMGCLRRPLSVIMDWEPVFMGCGWRNRTLF